MPKKVVCVKKNSRYGPVRHNRVVCENVIFMILISFVMNVLAVAYYSVYRSNNFFSGIELLSYLLPLALMSSMVSEILCAVLFS